MRQRGFLDRDGHALLLPERADAANMAPKAAASFFMLTSRSDGTTAQTALPSASAISVFSIRAGVTPSASAACSPMLSASGS